MSFRSSSNSEHRCTCKHKSTQAIDSPSPPSSVRSLFSPTRIIPCTSKSDTHSDDRRRDEGWKRFIRPYRKGGLKRVQSTPIENDFTGGGHKSESKKNTSKGMRCYGSRQDTDPAVRFQKDPSQNVGSISTLFNDGHTYLESNNNSVGSFGSDIDPKYIDATLKRRLAEMSVIYELRSKKLTEKLGKSQKEKTLLQNELQHLKRSFKEMTIAEKSRNTTMAEENAMLRKKAMKLQELQSQPRQPSTAEKQNLTLIHAENKQLSMTVDKLMKRVTEVEQSNVQSLNMLSANHKHEKQAIEDDHRRKVLNVMKDCDEKYQELERTCNEQLRSYQQDHEGNIQKLSQGNNASFQEYRLTTDNLIAARDAEINRLETIIQEQCACLQSEVVSMRSRIAAECSNEECAKTREELITLQKVVSKLRKTIKSLLLHLDKDVLAIFKDQKMQESDMKFNLIKQKAEITVKIFTESQTELKNALKRIDERYRSNITAIQKEIEHTSNVTKFSV